jgi:hypothetical protein
VFDRLRIYTSRGNAASCHRGRAAIACPDDCPFDNGKAPPVLDCLALTAFRDCDHGRGLLSRRRLEVEERRGALWLLRRNKLPLALELINRKVRTIAANTIKGFGGKGKRIFVVARQLGFKRSDQQYPGWLRRTSHFSARVKNFAGY